MQRAAVVPAVVILLLAPSSSPAGQTRQLSPDEVKRASKPAQALADRAIRLLVDGDVDALRPLLSREYFGAALHAELDAFLADRVRFFADVEDLGETTDVVMTEERRGHDAFMFYASFVTRTGKVETFAIGVCAEDGGYRIGGIIPRTTPGDIPREVRERPSPGPRGRNAATPEEMASIAAELLSEGETDAVAAEVCPLYDRIAGQEVIEAWIEAGEDVFEDYARRGQPVALRWRDSLAGAPAGTPAIEGFLVFLQCGKKKDDLRQIAVLPRAGGFCLGIVPFGEAR